MEQGAHPSFEDSYPEEWADVLRHISALGHRYEFLIPGHGKSCSDQFVKTMASTMSTAVRQARQPIRALWPGTVALVHQAPAGDWRASQGVQ